MDCNEIARDNLITGILVGIAADLAVGVLYVATLEKKTRRLLAGKTAIATETATEAVNRM